ncbi:hypothetical protein GGR33_003884 [Methylobacterium brachythecii]|uniref:Uncharacterized protein n=1 Tax=Methylobacterium brachythecii TaxID=1176177 RepID=A0A7W6ANK8_9HYPH|nr:hypothetical protein [Methylobacterium brachythecii]
MITDDLHLDQRETASASEGAGGLGLKNRSVFDAPQKY